MRIGRVLALILLVALVVVGAAFVMAPRPVAADSIQRLPSYQDARLLERAWTLPVARLYGPAGYAYQRNPSVCGPTSIANLLRSEGRPMTAEAVLAGTQVHPFLGLLMGGLTLDQEAEILRLRTGKAVTVLRGLSREAFRAKMAESNDPAHRVIVNFTRALLFGRGHGHFSPVLGYMPQERLVFVGDVNAGYRPWLAPVDRLYAAQDTIDPATHAKRGMLVVDAP